MTERHQEIRDALDGLVILDLQNVIIQFIPICFVTWNAGFNPWMPQIRWTGYRSSQHPTKRLVPIESWPAFANWDIPEFELFRLDLRPFSIDKGKDYDIVFDPHKQTILSVTQIE